MTFHRLKDTIQLVVFWFAFLVVLLLAWRHGEQARCGRLEPGSEAFSRYCSTSTPAVHVPARAPEVTVWTPVPRPAASSASRSRSGSVRRLEVTCYLATGHRTASGVWPREGMAASNLFRFGTRVVVPGLGEVVVTDRVGWGSDLDVFMDSRSRCLSFGRRRLEVVVRTSINSP